jgi:glutathione S-transferase
LYGGSYPTLDTVRKMIDYFDPLCPADRNLLLAGPSRDIVEADWKAFNGTLGTATVAFAYFHLLPLRQIMIRPLTEGTPGFETLAVRLASAVFAWFLR